MTRLEALRVPAVAKGRGILHSLIGTRPLRAYKDGAALAPESQPTWLYRTDTGVPVTMRTKLVLDDLIFAEASLLGCTRGGTEGNDARRPILDAWHIAYDRWEVDADGEITVDSVKADENEVIWIPGPGPGLLLQAAETIRGSRAMSAAWSKRVQSPFPLFILHENEDTGMDQDEVTDYVQGVAAARRDPENAVMFVPYNIDVEAHGSEQTDLFESGRNAERVDYANFFQLPTALLDGSVSAASLTYSTSEGKRNEAYDYGIPYWKDPIEARLSMDDIVPRGTSVNFDMTDLFSAIESPSGPTEQD